MGVIQYTLNKHLFCYFPIISKALVRFSDITQVNVTSFMTDHTDDGTDTETLVKYTILVKYTQTTVQRTCIFSISNTKSGQETECLGLDSANYQDREGSTLSLGL